MEELLIVSPVCQYSLQASRSRYSSVTAPLLRFALSPEGVTGELCEIDINECQSTPCQHEGLCLQLQPPGFEYVITMDFKCLCNIIGANIVQ